MIQYAENDGANVSSKAMMNSVKAHGVFEVLKRTGGMKQARVTCNL